MKLNSQQKKTIENITGNNEYGIFIEKALKKYEEKKESRKIKKSSSMKSVDII